MVEGKKIVEQAKGKKKARAASGADAQASVEIASGLSDYLKAFELHYGYMEEFKIQFRNPEKYEIVKKVGRGRYSDVYEGIRVDDDKKVAIKILKPSMELLNIKCS